MTAARRAEELRLAVMLLTRLPCGQLRDPAPSFAEAAWAYPAAGALVGALSGGAFCLAAWVGLPTLPSALLAVAVAVLATGAMHEDGLADVADGFGGDSDPARKLEIMRDSRVGTYGVVAVVLAIGLLASSMAGHPPTWASFFCFVALGAISRAMMLVPMSILRPARTSGLGAQAVLSGPVPLFCALGLAVGLSLPVVFPALVALWVMGMIAFGMTLLAKRQIGGQTGDVLGATQKLTEIAGWLTLAVLL